MDSDRKNELVELLVDIRRVASSDDTTFTQINNRELEQLTKSIYIQKSTWLTLRRYEQEFLRCCAASTQAKKAVLVSRSAARVCDVWLVSKYEEVVEVALKHGKPPGLGEQDIGYQYKRTVLADSDIMVRGNLRFTNPIRTAIDVARDGDLLDGIVAFESLLSRHNSFNTEIIKGECRAVMRRMQRTRGIGRAREALEKATNLSEPPYETRTRILIETAGFRCRAQVLIGKYRVDLLVEENLIVEIDGRIKLNTNPDQVYKDQVVREDWLREQGYSVLRVHTRDLDLSEADVLRRIREKLKTAKNLLPVLEPPRVAESNFRGRTSFFPQRLIDDLYLPGP